MPELPEIQTIVNSLDCITNEKIIGVEKLNILPLGKFFNDDESQYIINNPIIKITRIGKYIVFYFKNNYYMIIHLGMSGKLIISSNIDKTKHNHIKLILNNNLYLFYNDPRKFGRVHIVNNLPKYITNLGVDALDASLNKDYIYRHLIKHPNMNIKNMLLNQQFIAGIGNIYASEILYAAKISPFLQGYQLNIDNINNLIHHIKYILNMAILYKGTTIKDYRGLNNQKGLYQNKLNVYGKENQPCKRCNNIIIKTKQNNRATYYCSYCQKLEL